MGFLSNKFFQLLVVVGTVGGTAADTSISRS